MTPEELRAVNATIRSAYATERRERLKKVKKDRPGVAASTAQAATLKRPKRDNSLYAWKQRKAEAARREEEHKAFLKKHEVTDPVL